MDLRPSRHLPDLAGFWGCWPILGRLEEPFGDVGQVLLVVDSQDEVVAEDDLAHRRKHLEAVSASIASLPQKNTFSRFSR